MNNYPNYLNEFEQEFELDNGSADEMTNYEAEFSNNDQEWEFEEDHEQDGEFEFEEDHEYEEDREWLGGSRDNEFESRLYEALNGDHEDAFEMEQNVDRVLYEMEMDYFWKPLKSLWNKHKGKIFNLAKKYIPGSGILNTVQKLAGGDIRGFLKNAIIQGAGAFVPGGSIIANALTNQETPAGGNVNRQQVRQMVDMAKTAYQNQLRGVTNLNPRGDLKSQIRQLTRQSLASAVRHHGSPFKGMDRQVIRLRPGSVVTVHPDRIIIRQR